MNYDDWKLMSPPEEDEEEPIYCEGCNEEICFPNQSRIDELCKKCYELLY